MIKQKAHDEFFKSLAQLWESLIYTLKDVFKLAVLETRLAGRSLIIIFILLSTFLFLFVTAWFFLMATLAFWLTTLGLNWMLSLLCIVAVNILSMLLSFIFILKLKRNLKFKATKKHLGIERNHESKAKN